MIEFKCPKCNEVRGKLERGGYAAVYCKNCDLVFHVKVNSLGKESTEQVPRVKGVSAPGLTVNQSHSMII